MFLSLKLLRCSRIPSVIFSASFCRSTPRVFCACFSFAQHSLSYRRVDMSHQFSILFSNLITYFDLSSKVVLPLRQCSSFCHLYGCVRLFAASTVFCFLVFPPNENFNFSSRFYFSSPTVFLFNVDFLPNAWIHRKKLLLFSKLQYFINNSMHLHCSTSV